MQEVADLPTWQSTAPELGSSGEGQASSTQKKVRFPFKPEFNERVSLYYGPVTQLGVDMLVCPCNDKITEMYESASSVFDALTAEYKVRLQKSGPLKMGEDMVIEVKEVIANKLLLMMCPRYNPKFVTAAINSLNKCYLNAFQHLSDDHLRTIGFIPLHTEHGSFPTSIGADIATRTIRRFFEHCPENVDRVVICIPKGGSAQREYEKSLKLYFPRSPEEAIVSEGKLPRDVGTEWGEASTEERSIRISALPGMTGDDAEFSDDDDDTMVVRDTKKQSYNEGGEDEAPDFTRKQPSPDSRVLATAPEGSSDYVPPAYADILKKGREMDPKEMETNGFFYSAGSDPKTGKEVFIFSGKDYAAPALSKVDAEAYMARLLDQASHRQFILVYFHSTLTNSSDGIAWIYSLAEKFPKRVIANMSLFTVYPTFWFKMQMRMSRFASLSNLKECEYFDNLRALFHSIPSDSIRVAPSIISSDSSVKIVSSVQEKESSSEPAAISSVSADDGL